jgi:predicted enzyme related to lactoylglutathione lyase
MTDPRDSNRGTVALTDTRIRGRFLWHELMTSDTRAAAEFYAGVAGWTLQSWDQNPSYQMFLAAGVPMAGLMTMPEEAKRGGARTGWLGYIGTPDTDETARLATRLGGRVLKDAVQIPSVGRFIVLQDPQGAVFAAFTPEQEPVGDEQTGLGDFSWHELATSDGPAAFDFYRQLFAWEKTDAMDMGPGMGVYQMFGAHGQTLGGIYKLPAGAPNPPGWLPYAMVPSSERVAALVPKLGGLVINGPMDVPGGDSIVQLLDPQGGMFAVHSKGTAKAQAPGSPSASKSVAGESSRAKRAGSARTRPSPKRPRAKKTVRKATPKKRASRKSATPKGKVRATSQRRGRSAVAKVRAGKRRASRTRRRG